MATIDVTPAGNNLFQVQVTDEQGSSSHEVAIPDGYPQELGVEDVPLQDLVFESFRFLLEREPREQILGTFELPVIARYFPEYEDRIGDRVGAAADRDQRSPPAGGDPRT